MPNYDYLCQTCGKAFEIHHKMNDSPPKFGPHCSQKNCQLEKQLAAPAAMVRSSNPMVAGVDSKTPKREESNKQSVQDHTCSAGCALHRH